MTFIPLACPTIPDLKSFCELKKCLLNASVGLEPAPTCQQELIARTSCRLCLQGHRIRNVTSAIVRVFMPWSQHTHQDSSLSRSHLLNINQFTTGCLPLGDCEDPGRWDTVLLSGTSKSRSHNPLLAPKHLRSALFFSSLTLAHFVLPFPLLSPFFLSLGTPHRC